MTLLSSGNTSPLTNGSVFFPPLTAFLRITPKQTSSQAQLGGGECCKSQRGRRNGRPWRYCISSYHFKSMGQIKGNIMNNCHWRPLLLLVQGVKRPSCAPWPPLHCTAVAHCGVRWGKWLEFGFTYKIYVSMLRKPLDGRKHPHPPQFCQHYHWQSLYIRRNST